MNQTISKTLHDLGSKEVIVFTLKIALGALGLTLVPMGIFWNGFLDFIASYLSWIPWEWLQTTGALVATFALGYMLFIVLITLFTSLYSETLLIRLAKKHYPNTPVIGQPTIAASIAVNAKASIIFLILFILFIPLLFVPVLGQIAMLYLWSVLIKEPTVYDVGSLFIKDRRIHKEKSKKARTIALIASLFNYIPIVNIFAPIFAQILFLHHVLKD